MNRRSFLKIAASATASLALPACQAAPVAATTAPKTVDPTAVDTAPKATDTPIPTASIKGEATLVTLPGSETWTVVANSNGQEYRIFIKVPNRLANTPLPVVYLTDGNLNFQMTCAICNELVDDHYMNPAIIVGIGYLFDEFDEYTHLRTRDFTETGNEGGAPAFLRFLVDELMPLINTKYKTLPNDSTLIGHSYGGFFALYSLFQKKPPFQRYIIGSPSFWWDNNFIMNQMAALCDGLTDLPATVFICGGAKESPSHLLTPMQGLIQKLTSYKFASLKLTQKLFEDETHLSMIPFFISRGLREVMESS